MLRVEAMIERQNRWAQIGERFLHSDPKCLRLGARCSDASPPPLGLDTPQLLERDSAHGLSTQLFGLTHRRSVDVRVLNLTFSVEILPHGRVDREFALERLCDSFRVDSLSVLGCDPSIHILFENDTVLWREHISGAVTGRLYSKVYFETTERSHQY
ncbi:hypothetical protein SISNIDRAFT_469107 [Sistotremastrum niveocremeum HHB9708]|uniref:Uncharacterized protein n=1 Tax=Sistotremastrum niveocremeum HHB9708 TaxID=1314777 RepID=A0A164QE78_9AGAM|nr:hypothetical protein SISNIDRAFT_469107 [Sistotremastrum niveocremeum HHB9708]